MTSPPVASNGGSTPSLGGTVKASCAEFAAAAGVSGAEGAALLAQQGGSIQPTEARLPR